MATAKKLKSGSWRCLVYDCTDESGKRHYKSFTSDDPSPKGKRKAELMAAEYALDKKNPKQNNDYLALKDAYCNYIDSRSNVLSPSTIREYKLLINNSFTDLMDKNIYSLTQEDIQIAINKESLNCSPKTVRNKHGLLSAVMKMYRPDFYLLSALPQKTKPQLYIPTDEEVKKLIDTAKSNEDMLIAILLAAFGPMRRSEICGLKISDITNGTAHVHRAVVLDENHNWIEKTTKSVAGDRFIPLPDFVLDKISHKDDKIVNLNPDGITHRFKTILKHSELPHFRFHDLRHYSASIQHALGISDAYIMQRGGWGNDAVLKNVYRHTLRDKTDEMNTLANAHFSELCNTKCNTNQKK